MDNDNLQNSLNEDPLFDDENDFNEDYLNGHAVESVRDPANPMEWEEAVITEFIWQTGRTLPTSTPKMKQLLKVLLGRGMSPTEACDFFMKQMNVEKIPSEDDWDVT